MKRINRGVVGRLLAGAAIGTLGALALAAPATATDPEQETLATVEFANDCDGTRVTLHSGTDRDEYEWVVADGGPQGGAHLVDLAAGESETVFAPKSWATLSVFYFVEDGSTAPGWPQEWTWEAPAQCPAPGDQLPEDLGSWTFDCEIAEITFINPFSGEFAPPSDTFLFSASTGETAQVEISQGESATVQLPSSEGLVIEIRVVEESGAPGVLLADPLELRPELWAAAGCDEDADEGEASGDGGELPLTGASTGLIALGALVLLALGGGLFVVARRRRVTFSA